MTKTYNPAFHDPDDVLVGLGLYREKFYTTNMIYGNDAKILQKDGTKGPRLQFKEALAVGFQVTF